MFIINRYIFTCNLIKACTYIDKSEIVSNVLYPDSLNIQCLDNTILGHYVSNLYNFYCKFLSKYKYLLKLFNNLPRYT